MKYLYLYYILVIIIICCHGNIGGFIINNLESIIFFENIDKKDYSKAIKCLNGYVKNYDKKEYLNIDKNTLSSAIILDGVVDLISSDEDGKLILHNRFFKNQSFIFDIKDESKDFIAIENSKILILDLESIFKREKSNCTVRKNIMENIIKLQNMQTQELNYKVDIYLEKSLRKKIIKYFKRLQPMYSDNIIILPFKRSDLASYLSCDRSALSREMSRMEEEGLIKVNKNKVKLINI